MIDILTGKTVGSKVRWIAPGSPPESTARRVSSITGAGGHHTISSASVESPPHPARRSLREGIWRSLEGSEGGEKGTRNRRQDRNSRASPAGILAASRLLPRRARRSAASSWEGEGEEGEAEEEEEENLRERGEESLGRDGREGQKEEESVKEQEKAKEKVNASLRESEGFLISPPAVLFFHITYSVK